MALDKITADKIYEHSMERVANRPTAAARFGTGGLSPAQLKARYDQLSLDAINKINELIDKIKAGADGDTILKYMQTPIPGDDDDTPRTLYELLQDITNGNVATYLTLRSLTKTTLWDELHHIELELAEAKRIQAEEEAKRAAAENLRVEAESGRVTAEQARVVAESNRAAAENSRESQEQRRQSFEQARQNDEARRITAERAREAAIEEIIRAKESGELNGRSFSISKIYSSVADMNAGFATDGVELGQFVLIDTGNVDDEDNAKLFVKKETGYSYLTDMSGATGIQGPVGGPGPIGPQGVRGLAYYRLKSNLVGSLEYYPFTDFLIPEGYVPKPYDLVLYNDGNLGYIYSVTEDEMQAAVAHIPNAALKGPIGPDGFSPTVSVSKRNGVATVTITDKEGTKTVDILDGSANGGIDPGIFIDNEDIIPETEVVLDEPWGSGTQSYIHGDRIPTVGETYGVFWNGTKYSCVAKQSGISDAEVDIILGNGLSFGLPATEEPFCLRFYYAVAGDTQLTVVVASFDALETVNLRVALPPMIDPRYIPNMYYEEGGGTVEILPEMTIAGEYGGAQILFTSPLGLVIGETYTVTVDGVEYERTGMDYGSMAGAPFPICAIGNLGILGVEGVADTGEPFLIMDAPEPIEEGLYGLATVLSQNAEITISIKQDNSVIHKIDNKFLDLEWIPETKTVKGDEVVAETTLTYVENASDYRIQNHILSCEVGKKYIVKWRGSEYLCEAFDAAVLGVSGFVGLGNKGRVLIGAGQPGIDTGEPFLIYGKNTVVSVTRFIPLDNSTEDLTVSIHEATEQGDKIPEKFLPETDVVDVSAWAGDMYANGTASITDSNLLNTLIGIAQRSDKIWLNLMDGFQVLLTKTQTVAGQQTGEGTRWSFDMTNRDDTNDGRLLHYSLEFAAEREFVLLRLEYFSK